MRELGTFFCDFGAVYGLRGAELSAPTMVDGLRTRVTYTSDAHRVRLTGAVRRQSCGSAGRMPAQRCVLTLDTGEGLVDLPGAVVTR